MVDAGRLGACFNAEPQLPAFPPAYEGWPMTLEPDLAANGKIEASIVLTRRAMLPPNLQ